MAQVIVKFSRPHTSRNVDVDGCPQATVMCEMQIAVQRVSLLLSAYTEAWISDATWTLAKGWRLTSPTNMYVSRRDVFE